MSGIHVVDRITDLRAALEGKGVVGFVPTMGALHAGHAGLIERARAECQAVVVSVFVNPTQFAPGEDFDSYPRTREADVELCGKAGADLVWFPRAGEIYPPGNQTWVEVSDLGSRFEGESRPIHFRGVATVVSKLFHAVKPQRAYFGEKDLQQLFVIRRMVRDLLMDIEVVGVPTVREATGLARSSRNEYLRAVDRERAAAIYRGLQAVRESVAREKPHPAALRELFEREIEAFEGAALERFDLFKPELSGVFEADEPVGDGFCSVAVLIGKVRLIDNISLCS